MHDLNFFYFPLLGYVNIRRLFLGLINVRHVCNIRAKLSREIRKNH